MTLELHGSAEALFVGIDVGGTKVRALVGSDPSRPLRELTEPTSSAVVEQITRMIHELAGDRLAAIAVGVPGVVDPRTGCVEQVPNVPALDGLPLQSALSALFDVPVTVENDLVAAAVAEHQLGGHGVASLAVLAAGTGIGLGLVVDGLVIRGDNGAAGEIANVPLRAGSILEDVVSSSGLIAAYRAFSDDRSASVRDILERAAAGESVANLAVSHYAEHLAIAVKIVAATLDPGAIVLTGGIGSTAVLHQALLTHLHGTGLAERIRRSELRDHSPARGALLLAADIARQPAYS